MIDRSKAFRTFEHIKFKRIKIKMMFLIILVSGTVGKESNNKHMYINIYLLWDSTPYLRSEHNITDEKTSCTTINPRHFLMNTSIITSQIHY